MKPEGHHPDDRGSHFPVRFEAAATSNKPSFLIRFGRLNHVVQSANLPNLDKNTVVVTVDTECVMLIHIDHEYLGSARALTNLTTLLLLCTCCARVLLCNSTRKMTEKRRVCQYLRP